MIKTFLPVIELIQIVTSNKRTSQLKKKINYAVISITTTHLKQNMYIFFRKKLFS